MEAVKSLDEIGGPKTVDPLIRAVARPRSRNADPRHRRPGERVSAGISQDRDQRHPCSAPALRSRPSSPTPTTRSSTPIVEVRPEVIAALGKLASRRSQPRKPRERRPRTGHSARPRGDSGSGRGPAFQGQPGDVRIADRACRRSATSAAPADRVPAARSGRENSDRGDRDHRHLLRNAEAAPDVRDVLARTALRQGSPRGAESRWPCWRIRPTTPCSERYLTDNDDALRAAGAEGLARLKNPADLPTLDKAFNAEHKISPRLSDGFRSGFAGQSGYWRNSARSAIW